MNKAKDYKEIGSGAFSKVYLSPATVGGSSPERVTKEYTDEHDFYKHWAQECAALRRLSGHKSFPLFIECGTKTDWNANASSGSASDSRPVSTNYIVMSAHTFSLYDLIFKSSDGAINSSPLSASAATSIIEGLCRAVLYMHSLGIAHCDLKPDNIMLNRASDDAWAPVIIDFNSSRFVGKELHRCCNGTRRYMSPECILEDPVGTQTDLWSLGITVYEIVARAKLFNYSRDYDYSDVSSNGVSTSASDYNDDYWAVIYCQVREIYDILGPAPARFVNKYKNIYFTREGRPCVDRAADTTVLRSKKEVQAVIFDRLLAANAATLGIESSSESPRPMLTSAAKVISNLLRYEPAERRIINISS
jgi:serine/threonine protein kinase